MGEQSYRGHCFCGAVEVTVTGEPKAMGYCHCASCREWSAAPVNAFSLWSPETVKVTKGADKLGEFHRSETSHRKFCTKCGGHVLTDHPTFKLVDVYAAVIPDFAFKPAIHLNYQEKVLSVRDGLPKYKEMPKDFGGSGETISD
jgi:hypothetical protein